VSGLDSTNSFGSFSSQGSKVELSAPGTTVTGSTGLTSTCLGGGTCDRQWFGSEYSLIQGTSFAAPHVASAAAILAAAHPSWPNYTIRQRLDLGATDISISGRDTQTGYGLVNVTGALNWVQPYTASITGPSSVRSRNACSWTVSPLGGVSPYTYSWNVGGTSDRITYQNTGTSFTLTVTVTDATGAQKIVSKAVTVSSSASLCTV
jgi:subtilisin family serine protease